jgi:23S rRNA pseudouridine1911/1915/1917 synthase
VLVDDSVVTAGKVRVRVGQVVDVTAPTTNAPSVAADATVAIPVVYEDDDVVVVDKPAGIVVHPGAGRREGTLVAGLLARYPELAGVGEAARREIERRYLALVWGVPSSGLGVIDAPMGRSAREPTKMAVVAGGRPARTGYEVQRTFSSPVASALLACRLETGRTHQIRVHLAAIGHPVVGDGRYGGHRPGLDARRPMLHAEGLSFTHPVSGERVELVAPIPPDMAGVLAGLA